MKQFFFFFLCCLLASGSLLAQKGTVAGKVIELESGFEVIGGNVLVVGQDGVGTVTDLDGTYQLELAPGTYTLEYSYIGFASQQITDIEVKANELTTVDVQLGEEAVELDLGVTVTAKAFRNTEAALLTIQKKAPGVLDGISSAQISKSGDSDVASAVRRVTGVTIEGGKYVYIRGLGDRYSKTTMNGAEIPGLDPNRNTVQMDLFPTNLIDNIIVFKTFTPNLPGDFSGGYVDIATKDFPEQFTFNASVSLTYNTVTTFNDENYLSSPTGGLDWLGFDDGTRAAPEIATNTEPLPEYSQGLNDAAVAQQIEDLTAAFPNTWQQFNESPFLNYGASLSVGNQVELGGKPLGLIFALSYSRNFQAVEEAEYGIYEQLGPDDQVTALNGQLVQNETQGSATTLWGAMFSSSYKLDNNNKIGLTLMRNQSGEASTREQIGKKNVDDPADDFYSYTWAYRERALSTGQLRGKHIFANANNFEINWQSSISLSEQQEPDYRFFTMRYNPDTDRFRIKPSSDRPPVRFYRDMEQYSFDNKLDFTLPFNQWNGLKSELKFGGSAVVRDRTFLEDAFTFNNQDFQVPDGDFFTYFQPENLIQAGETGFADPNGPYITDNYLASNNYEASQAVYAGFAMVELPLTNKLRTILGGRVETTNITLLTYDTLGTTIDRFPELDGDTPILDNVDFLPSINLNYEATDKMKIRAAYSRTIARPTFRELAPFASFDREGGFIFVGNPNLTRTLVDNVDLRWEMFPTNNELISFSVFYKNFENPIERTFNTEAANTELTYENVPEAFLVGAEFEFRKNLGFLAAALDDFDFSLNGAYIYSETTIPEQELELIRTLSPTAEDTRPMFGQAPYTANILLSYNNLDRGTQANVSFNVVGPRIVVVTKGATPEIFLQPRPLLNFNISQEFGENLRVKLSANNLLNARYREILTFKDQEFESYGYLSGLDFGLSVSYNLNR